MAHILITGSADGLGRAAAETLLGAGRLAAVEPLINRGASAVIGDFADLNQNAGTRRPSEPARPTRRGDPQRRRHQRPTHPGRQRRRAYLLTVLINRPQRLIYLSSDMHEGGRAKLDDLDWSGQRATASYSDSNCS